MNVAGRGAKENRAVSTADKLADKLADELASCLVNNNRTPLPCLFCCTFVSIDSKNFRVPIEIGERCSIGGPLRASAAASDERAKFRAITGKRDRQAGLAGMEQ